jgi:hypothetical protein
MRPNRYMILVSILFGAFGAWFSAEAVGQYLNTTRSFASVDTRYVEGSFSWEDSDHEEATAEVVITNDSDNNATLDYLGMNLYFDGTFAGARYEPWDAIDIPSGESVSVEIPFLVSITEMRSQGSEAELSLRGQMRLNFEGIERDMTVPTGGTIGQVPYEESES